MSVTIRDIAKQAGVSPTTVSFALRDNPKISASTRAKVKEVAAAMGYKPDPYVSILMANKRANRPVKYEATLGFLTAWEEKDGWRKVEFCRRVFEGVKTRAASLGFQVEPFWVADPNISIRRWEQIFLTRNITGMILAPLPEAGEFPPLHWEKFTVATAGNTILSPRISKVTPHQYHVMAEALRQIEARGCTKVGLMLDHWVDDKVDDTWSAAYLTWRQKQPDRDHIPIFWLDEDASSPKQLRAWFKTYRPDVIVGYSYGYELLEKIDVTCPKDVKFVNLDVKGKSTRIQFAGINQSAENVGRGVVDLVVAQLHRNERGLPVLPKTMMLEGIWQEGDTFPSARPT